ncbi:restriction endonuclease [Enterococcus sp. DIV0876]|uniref:restriction endonuclease n=1 Tax=Enterococcus sp. DIV0876 TaxID=2774633 RepID=UPI003D2FE656
MASNVNVGKRMSVIKPYKKFMLVLAITSLDKAIVLTNSYFTDSAKELPQRLNVALWDRSTLTKMTEHTATLDKK